MAFITKEELKNFRDTGIIESKDFVNLATLSRKKKLKRGETGYSNVQMRNFTLERSACSPEVKELIMEYFNNKLKAFKKVVDKIEI